MKEAPEKEPEKKKRSGLFEYVAKIGISFWLTGIMGLVLAGKKVMPIMALFLLKDYQNIDNFEAIIDTINSVASEGDAYIFAIFTAIATNNFANQNHSKNASKNSEA